MAGGERYLWGDRFPRLVYPCAGGGGNCMSFLKARV